MATLEMKIVLRELFAAGRIEPGYDGPELTRRRSITVSPKLGARTVLRDREPAATPESDGEPAAVAV